MSSFEDGCFLVSLALPQSSSSQSYKRINKIYGPHVTSLLITPVFSVSEHIMAHVNVAHVPDVPCVLSPHRAFPLAPAAITHVPIAYISISVWRRRAP